MKQMKVPRGTARAKRRASGSMDKPSVASLIQMAKDQMHLNMKMGIALFHKHGTARLPY